MNRTAFNSILVLCSILLCSAVQKSATAEVNGGNTTDLLNDLSPNTTSTTTVISIEPSSTIVSESLDEPLNSTLVDPIDSTTSKSSITTTPYHETTTKSIESVSPRPKLRIIISEPDYDDSMDNKSAASPYPPDFMPDYIRNNGGVIVHILILAYISLALGVVCDLYFLSSLEIISNVFKLPPDIAGATFMAIGTSAPELFTSLIGVFISEDDIGTGTILGSAVFNLIFIPAACGLAVYFFSVQSNTISKFAILRDSIFYLITTTILLLCLKDNEVDWIESLLMLMMFVIYLVIMYFNAKFSDYVSNQPTNDPLTEVTPLLGAKTEEWDIEDAYGRRLSLDHSRPRLSSMNENGSICEEENWIEGNCFVKWLMFPVTLLYKITIPKPTGCCFPITFVMSIFYISVLTYLAVWIVNTIGDTFGIPDTVGGLTILAAGTSFPELISSVLVVKRAGLADMAICNSIGSNIFDILICLGLPWFIKSVIQMFRLGTASLELTMVPVQSNGLPLTTFTLILTIIALLCSLSAFKWKLGLGIGITCTIIYVIFLVISSVLEIFFS